MNPWQKPWLAPVVILTIMSAYWMIVFLWGCAVSTVRPQLAASAVCCRMDNERCTYYLAGECPTEPPTTCCEQDATGCVWWSAVGCP